MFSVFKQAVDSFRGAGSASVAIPIFDGPLRPNNHLDDAEVLLDDVLLNDIAADGSGGLYAAQSERLIRIDAAGEVRLQETFDAPIQALCCSNGVLAVAQEGRVVLRGGNHDGTVIDSCNGHPLKSLNAVAFDDGGDLYISQGSMTHGSEQWKRDLMSRGASGRVLRFAPGSDDHVTVVADGLQYCHGICAVGDRVLVSESWAHRIIDVAGGKIRSVLSDLPGYPARLSPAADGGFWLSLFAKRSQLIELVLRERVYREEMMRSIAPDYWIAPSLSSGKDFLEPLQFGAVRQMGIFKPWAPTSSYGIAIRLNENLNPVYSFHSRAGGRNHGTVSAVESGGNLIVLSKGGERLLKLPLSSVHDKN